MRIHTACFVVLFSMAARAAPGLSLEGGPFLPYRINHATARSTGGLFGNVELAGQRWDGVRVPLCRMRATTRSEVLDLVFYLDEEIRGLELQVDGQGPASIDIAAGEGKAGAIEAGETALRSRMRSLNPPVHLAREGEAPERFSLGGSDLVMTGFQASNALFADPVSRAPLVPLGGFVLAVLIAAMIAPSTRRRRIIARALTVSAVLGATVAIVYLAAPRPRLYSVALPADGPDARVSGVVERMTEELPGYTRVTYAAGRGEGSGNAGSGTVNLVGLWAPGQRGVPVADLVPPGSLVRFSSPPLVTLLDGEFVFGSKGFVTGWVVHENP
jgi:hypothetical protein